jgi:hypothetical protein
VGAASTVLAIAERDINMMTVFMFDLGKGLEIE